MNNISLPEDIKKQVKKKVISHVLHFLLLELAAGAVNLMMFDTLSSRLVGWIHILIIIALQVAPFILTKFPLKLIDSSWRGEVIAVDIESKTDAYIAGGTKVYPYTKHVILLTVKQSDGKITRIKAKEVGQRISASFAVPNEGDIKQYVNYYSAGDKVYHFYGVENYYIVRGQSETKDCIMCGAQNPRERTTCFDCGYSLL